MNISFNLTDGSRLQFNPDFAGNFLILRQIQPEDASRNQQIMIPFADLQEVAAQARFFSGFWKAPPARH